MTIEELKKQLTPQDLQLLDQRNDNALQQAREKYFTVDINPNAKPDMVGSATSKSDMGRLPDNRFGNVHFENVDCNVFLDPASWKIIERITKKGGTIIIPVASRCHRLVPFVLSQTKWKNDIDKNLIHSTSGYDLKLINH